MTRLKCAPACADELAQAAKGFAGYASRCPSFRHRASASGYDIAEERRLTDPSTWPRRLVLSYRRYGDAWYLDRMHDLASKVTPTLLAEHAKHIFKIENLALMTEMPKG